MSFMSWRTGLASTSRSLCRHNKVGQFTNHRSFRFNSTESGQPTRHSIGRIIPKRIAVRAPRPDLTAQEGIPKRSIWRPIVFCLALGGGGYMFAAAYTNEQTDYWTAKLGSGSWWNSTKIISNPTDREMLRAQIIEHAKEAQQTANKLPQMLSFLPSIISTPLIRSYILIKEFELNTPPSRIASVELVLGMGAVFVLWQSRALQPFMRKWFLHHPVTFGGGARAKWRDSVTLFTSTISHSSLVHIAFNSLALVSFGSAAYAYLAVPPPNVPKIPSSTHDPHFYAFLLTAGLFASLASHLHTNLFRLPRLVKLLRHPARLSTPQALASQQGINPSLGASGAIYAAVTLTACAYPDKDVGIIFLPFVAIPIRVGVFGMVALDIIGLFKGWRMFDHVAHLGGALFGVLYYQYGREIWYRLRKEMYVAAERRDESMGRR